MISNLLRGGRRDCCGRGFPPCGTIRRLPLAQTPPGSARWDADLTCARGRCAAHTYRFDDRRVARLLTANSAGGPARTAVPRPHPLVTTTSVAASRNGPATPSATASLTAAPATSSPRARFGPRSGPRRSRGVRHRRPVGFQNVADAVTSGHSRTPLLGHDHRPPRQPGGLHHTALISGDVEPEPSASIRTSWSSHFTELVENRDYPGSSHFSDIGNGNLLASLDFAGLQVGPYAGECPVTANPGVAEIPAVRLVWDLEEAPVLRRACNNTKMAAGPVHRRGGLGRC